MAEHADLDIVFDCADPDRRARIEAEAARLSAAGATVARQVEEGDGFWIVIHDVEGNEFCVI
jgi:predicted enzyme related to lactoylglutathione lyase